MVDRKRLQGRIMKKDTLIDLYWILDALQRGGQPDAGRVSGCFIAIRDALLDPDTEQIVDHIRGVLERSEAAADVLAHQLISRSSAATRRPLPALRLRELMAAAQGEAAGDDLAVAFGRRVEAEHGIAVGSGLFEHLGPGVELLVAGLGRLVPGQVVLAGAGQDQVAIGG
jgi:hypothetical protein